MFFCRCIHLRVRGFLSLIGIGVWLLSPFLGLASSPFISGKTALDTTKSYLLGDVIISAKGLKRDIIPVQILAGKELQKLNVCSVADAVRYFSGIQVKDYGGIGGLKTINIRSMGSQHVGVFYDGIELGNAQNGIIDLGRYSLDNMESIALYNGQKGSVFQPAKDFGSAGSVYLTARVPRFNPLEKEHLGVKIKVGSFGTINPALTYERKWSERLSSMLSAEYMSTTGKYRFSYKKKDGYDTTEVRRNGDVNALRVEQGLFGSLKDGDWKVKAYLYRSERGYPGASVREEPGKFTHQDRQWDANFFLQSSFRKKPRSFFETLWSAKYAYDYLHYRSDPNLDVSTMYVDNRYEQQELYFSSANKLELTSFWDIGFSADYQYNTLHADLVDFVYPKRNTVLYALASALSFESFKIQASGLGTYVHETTKISSAAKDKSKFTPTVLMSWATSGCPGLSFRAFYKKIFRLPTLNDLYYTFIGNKDLNPEYTKQYNLGMSFKGNQKTRFEIQIDAYYNEVTDKIIAMPTSNQFRWTMVNLGNVEIRGLDASLVLGWDLSNRLLLNTRLNYSYQKAQNFTDPSSVYYGDQIPYIPLHSGSFILNASYGSWDANYSFIYTGERYEASANIAENYARPWYTSDVSIAKNCIVAGKEIKLSAQVNNLFNQQYEVVQCYPMPGIHFYFTIQYSLQ